LYRYFAKNCLASMPKIHSLMRQLIPFVRTALRPLRLCANIVSLVAPRHRYLNGTAATIPAATSSRSFTIAHNPECEGGITYPGLVATASLYLAASVGLIFLILIALYAVGRPTQIWLGGFYFGEREPYLQMMSSRAVTIRWQSIEKFSGVVRYGKKEDLLNETQRETVPTKAHEIRLTNLEPATKYFYSVGDGIKTEFKGESFWFKTAPETKTDHIDSAATRFWVTGDQGDPTIIQRQVRDAMIDWARQNSRTDANAPLFDFWITTGDNAYTSGTNPQFQTAFFEPYKTILRNTPVWPAYGNHDARRRVFLDIFSFPENAESGGVASGSENYYSFDYANIHFVMLDTSESDLDKDGEMLSWLKNDLQKTKQQWLIAVFHHPPYTKGSHDSDSRRDSRGRLVSVRGNIIPLLEKFGVDLVLSGHSHMYERSALINCHYGFSDSFSPDLVRSNGGQSIYYKKENKLAALNGTVYGVIGSSSKVDGGPLDHPALPYSYQEAGSIAVDIDSNRLKAFFVNKEGVVKDQFEIIKGVADGVESRECE